MNRALVIGGAVVGFAALFVLMGKGAKSKSAEANPRGDAGLGRHRGLAAIYRPGGGIGAQERLPSEQEPKITDRKGYPYQASEPSALAQGHWKGPGDGPIGYSELDYGPTPIRIPRLWRDSIRYWDGVAQRGYTQQNYRVFLFHLRPSMPTRGYRSVSGVLYNGGPTSSRRRVPAVFVPSVVA